MFATLPSTAGFGGAWTTCHTLPVRLNSGLLSDTRKNVKKFRTEAQTDLGAVLQSVFFQQGHVRIQRSENVARPANRAGQRAKLKPVRRNRL